MDQLPPACQEIAGATNISLLKYSEANQEFCEPFTLCDSTGSRHCPLYGRRDADGIGLELELRFQGNAEGMQCESDQNSTKTVTFIMTKGEQANPQRIYDNSSCTWVARWAGLPENPLPEIDVDKESDVYAYIASIVLIAVAGVGVLGICSSTLGHKPGSGSRRSGEYEDWSLGTARDSVMSLESSRSAGGGSLGEALLPAAFDSSVDVDFGSGSIQ